MELTKVRCPAEWHDLAEPAGRFGMRPTEFDGIRIPSRPRYLVRPGCGRRASNVTLLCGDASNVADGMADVLLCPACAAGRGAA